MKKKKLRLKKTGIIFLILLGTFCFSVGKIGYFFWETHKSNELKDNLVEEVITEFKVKTDNDEDTTTSTFSVDFEKLLSKNADAKGWIRYNNNKIDYPIVQASDNDYYLNRNFLKASSIAGSIFMDYRNKGLDDQNVILYGHSMADNSMFGSLREILTKGFFDKEENNYIELVGLDNKILKYQIFSYYTIEKEEYYITPNFSSDSEYLNFLNVLKKRSFYNFNVDLDTNDKILTLSTCYGYENTSKRKVVHAKQIINNN